MWLEFIQHMVNYYSGLDTFYNIAVEGGTDGKKPAKPLTLYILRNIESDIDFHKQSSGTISLWIECWARNDSKNPMDAYKALYDLEKKFLEAFADWTRTVGKDLGVAAKITIPHFVGDGERQRPLCGSQATIIINWKR